MLQDFLKQCFHKDPSQRPSAEVLCEHPWLKNNWDALQVCLDLTRDMLQALNPLGFIESSTARQYTIPPTSQR